MSDEGMRKTFAQLTPEERKRLLASIEAAIKSVTNLSQQLEGLSHSRDPSIRQQIARAENDRSHYEQAKKILEELS